MHPIGRQPEREDSAKRTFLFGLKDKVLLRNRPAQRLPALEGAILQILLQEGPSTVREVQQRLKDKPACRTIQRIMHTMQKAGRAQRALHGKAFVYRASRKEDIGTGGVPKDVAERVLQAAALAGVHVQPEDIGGLLDALDEQRNGCAQIRELRMENSLPPAYIFQPLPPGADLNPQKQQPVYGTAPHPTTVPRNLEDLAFATVIELGDLIRRRKISSIALTEMYLGRIKRYDPLFHFVVTLTEDRALSQAREADASIRRGRYRGPLHGLPWGAKDLLAVKGYPTTWGARGFEDQRFEEDATVVKRLDAAGAVLVAKVTLGALALGDHWFGGLTRNPWNPRQAAGGSSGGSASTTSAGCVAFSVATETMASIAEPSTLCGVTGLRPTFGFVPRTGAMTLSWTLDKIGVICRAVEDCAIVLQAIYGPDGQDLAVRETAFNWDASFDWKSLRVGYLKDSFDLHTLPPVDTPPQGTTQREEKQHEIRKREYAACRAYDLKYDLAALEKLDALGLNLIPLQLPRLPYDSMRPIINAEAAAAFDELSMTGLDELLAHSFRVARFYPAIDYIQANRARTLAIREVSTVFSNVDVVVASTFSEQLRITNFTGHPAVIVPNGLRGADAPRSGDPESENHACGPGTPVSITFLGNHYQDAKLCALSKAYQDATGFHKLHPNLR
jgi:Asp-tRNA(Asn)/Glu-tRNA(Gln) amidotransferase A subunit family amidase/predicted transcriptional regulator